MLYKIKQKLYHRKIRKGKATYGRTEVPIKGTLSAKVIRVDGRVEKLGEIAKLE